MAPENNKNDQRREEIRKEFWPDATPLIWDPSKQRVKGFVAISRLMPWVTTLIRHLSKSGDPSSVYWELWCRHMGQGIVEVWDEEECAFAAGYTSSRALRTWHDHIRILSELYFISTEELGNRKVGYVLLPNPLAIARVYHELGKTPRGWWPSLKTRAREIGADIPDHVDMDFLVKAVSHVKPVQTSERVEGLDKPVSQPL